jgi:dihydrofolate reductase
MKNQRKLVIFIATSLDGYIAREDDSLDWLFNVEGEGDNGYSKFYETVDTILLGRRTYDWIIQHEKGDFPYKNKACYVFSRTPNRDNNYVKFVNEDIVGFINKLKSEEGKNIWLVGGGELIHPFVKEKLIDELIITVAPIVIGKGIPLFKEDEFELELSLKGINRFNQFAELHYEVKK